MASITSIISPSKEEGLETLDQTAVEQQPSDIGWVDYAKQSFTEAYKNNTGYTLGAMAWQDGDSPVYSKEQLSELYADTPSDYWKGSANAFQAELLYDRFKESQEKQELYNLLTTVSSPDTANVGLAADVLGAGAGLTAAVADPFNYGVGKVGSVAAGVLGPMMTKVAPRFMNSIASSRMGMNLFNEVGINLISDVGVTHTLNASALDDYEQQDRSLWETVKSSVGTAIIFGTARSIFGRKSKAPVADGGGFVDATAKQNFHSNGDKAIVAVNSESANLVAYNHAVAHTVTSVDPSIPSSVNTRIATAAFNNQNKASFDTRGGTYFGAYEKTSGTSDYPGTRYGDTHVFVDSPDRAQGIVNTYGKDSLYEVYSHAGDGKLLDLETTVSSDFPAILDKIEEEFGSTIWNQLKDLGDDPTLAELYRAVTNLPNPDGVSGFDVVEMFEDINKGLSAQEYDGTLHTEMVGEGHRVMSIFKDKISGDKLTKLHEGKAELQQTLPESQKINDRIEAPVRTLDGQELPVTSHMEHDTFYDDDLEFSNQYIDFNDPEVMKEVNESITAEIKLEDSYQVVKDDLDETLKQVAQRYHGTSSELSGDLLDTTMHGTWSSDNVYGNGFYSTADIKVGQKYMKKGKGKTPTLYRVQEVGEVKAFDLDADMNPSIHQALTDIAVNYDHDGDGYMAEIMDENTSLGRALDQFRSEGRSINLSKDDFQEMVMDMQDYLKTQGYGAFDHVGGNLTKGKKHNVRIYWDPSTQVKVDKLIDAYVKIEEQLKVTKEEIKADPPDKQEEFAKAVENCLRKG